MTFSAVAFSNAIDSDDAGSELSRQIARALKDTAPDVAIVFASAKYDYARLLHRLDEGCKPKLLVGCSSAGEFTSGQHGDGGATALALCSDTIKFAASVGRSLSRDYRQAAENVIAGFEGVAATDHLWRTALVFADPLSGYGEELIQHLTLLTDGRYQFVGGGAGDDGKFQKTHVFFGREALPDAVVALEMLSQKPIAIGAAHGWKPSGKPMRVTDARGLELVSLNAMPAADIYEDYAVTAQTRFDRESPLPFFLHHVLGVNDGSGVPRLRVPLAVNAGGAIQCAAEVPQGTTVNIMQASVKSASEAAQRATHAALAQLAGAKPSVALFFDCVATRLRMGKEFGVELDALRAALPDIPFIGFNTYGQIVRGEGQFNGFHNCTAVVCVIPE